MSISRLLVACVMAAASASAAFACSSFSASSDSPADDAGNDTSTTDGGPAGADGGGDAGTCTAPLATDPQNCGRCGHSCLGGTCSAGECQPVLIGTSNDEAVVDVAVDAQRVMWLTSTGFWSNAGHVFACPLAGCANGGPGTSLTGPPISTGNLASDGTNTFFSVPYGGGQEGIRQVLANGVVQKIGQRRVEAVRLQMRGGKLYFATLYESSTPGTYTGHVYRSEGADDTLIGDFSSMHNLQDMVVVGDRAFFAATETSFLGACPLADPEPPTCTPTDFTTVTAYRLTTDGTSVIWTDFTDVYACRADQTTCVKPLALVGRGQLGGGVASLTFDHGHLYVSTSANDIFECALPDCSGTLRKLVHETSRLYESGEPSWGHSVAADDTAVYWSAVDGMAVPDGDGGTVRTGVTHRVMKLAK